jgi:hypothetical protein
VRVSDPYVPDAAMKKLTPEQWFGLAGILFTVIALVLVITT